MIALRAPFVAILIGVGGPAFAGDAFSSDWAIGLKSSARLVAGGEAQGRFFAGVEIKLAPGAITYWRNPGDAGLPPVLSFEGSTNIAKVRALFPAPQRLSEGAGEAFGYDHSLILPIDVEANDPGKPVTIALKLDYAVCEKICVPAKANLTLTLAPGGESSPYADAIARAVTEAPRPVPWASLAGKVDLAALDGKTWRLCVAGQEGSKRDLFVEAPARWWFNAAPDASAPAGQACFRVTLEEKPDEAGLPVEARLTFTGGSGAFETTVAFGEPPTR